MAMQKNHSLFVEQYKIIKGKNLLLFEAYKKVEGSKLKVVSNPQPTTYNCQIFSTLLTVFLLISTTGWGQVTITLTTGTSWTVPANVNSIRVECWGGGGAGGSAMGYYSFGFGTTKAFSAIAGGGAGGAYARINTFFVAPGGIVNYSIGAGGISSVMNGVANPGGDTWFSSNSTILAKGGAGALSLVCSSSSGNLRCSSGWGTSNGSIGDVVYAGGSGASGSTYSGGGGSSAGTSSKGNDASNANGAAAVTGGGIGGDGRTASNGNGVAPGSGNGGGGGGAWASSDEIQRLGGSGASGKIIITYFTSRFGVLYHGNGNTGGSVPLDGSSPYASNGVVTVLGNTGSLVKTGFIFTGWNTAADGSGTAYEENEIFNISANTTLFAQWGVPTATAASSISDNSFTANWEPVNGVSSYRLDVATTDNFFGPSATIAAEGFENKSSLFTETTGAGAFYIGSSSNFDAPALSPFFTEGSYGFGKSAGSVTLTSSAINTSDYSSAELSFNLASYSIGSWTDGADNTDNVTVSISTDGVNYKSTLRVVGNTNARWSFNATGAAITNYDGDNSPVVYSPAAGGNRTTDGYSNITV
ncbi:MAG: InlB B-repeat-containing protein, partial [Bacteroidetes bacterium]|nr:InlB B-repeat-containing protein [Bacteroidota bacterium]